MTAIWRNRDLEQVIDGSLDREGFTEQGIARLVESTPAESEVVEYKDKGDFWKVMSKSPCWNAKQERAKDICSPANGRGAVLIWGVTDKTSAPVKDRLKPFVLGEADPHRLIEQFKADVRQYATPIPL